MDCGQIIQPAVGESWFANNLSLVNADNSVNICCIKNLCGLFSRFQGEFQNPWNFPHDWGDLLSKVDLWGHAWVYTNEMTPVGPKVV